MRILYVTNMYPSKKGIYDGIFIKEQIEYYNKKYRDEYEIFIIKGQQSKLNYLKSIFQINWKLAKQKFDLIHIHFGLSGIFLLFNPFIRIPSVLTLHGSDIQPYKKKEELTQKISRLVARKATRVIVQNDNMFRLLKGQEKKIVKIPCGIDAHKFSHSRNNGSNVFKIGFPSERSRPVKNFALFKEIMDRLDTEGINVDYFEFVNLTRDQVATLLSKLDCLLMTSLSEGSPQIIKEALASGVPIISTNVGDVRYLLEGVTNCFVIDSFEAEPFVEKLRFLIQLPWEERKTNGLARLQKLEISQEITTHKIHQLYKGITQKK